VRACDTVQIDLHGQPEWVFINNVAFFNGSQYWNACWSSPNNNIYFYGKRYKLSFRRLPFEEEDIPGFEVDL